MPHAMNHTDDKIAATPCHLVVSRLLAADVGHRATVPRQTCHQQISRVDISSVWFAVAGILIMIILEDSSVNCENCTWAQRQASISPVRAVL